MFVTVQTNPAFYCFWPILLTVCINIQTDPALHAGEGRQLPLVTATHRSSTTGGWGVVQNNNFEALSQKYLF